MRDIGILKGNIGKLFSPNLPRKLPVEAVYRGWVIRRSKHLDRDSRLHPQPLLSRASVAGWFINSRFLFVLDLRRSDGGEQPVELRAGRIADGEKGHDRLPGGQLHFARSAHREAQDSCGQRGIVRQAFDA